MARKHESGIPYFPMNSGTVLNSKIKLLFQEFGSDGFWIWHCLLSEIYSDNGYFFSTKNSDSITLFATDVCKKQVSLVNEVINGCVRRGLFSKSVFDSFNILTSRRIQENYLEAVSRRKGVKLIKEYLLIPVEPSDKIVIVDINGENVDINSLNVNINPENVDAGTQSKVKQSKVEKSKVEKSKVEQSKACEQSPPDDVKNLLLAFLEKHRKKYYSQELQLAKAEIAKYVEKHAITDELLKTNDEIKRKFDAEDERIYNKFLKYPMILEIEKCYNHYRKFEFKIKGEPITNWENVLPSWMDKREEFRKGSRK